MRQGPSERDVKSDLSRDDGAYETVFPLEEIDLIYWAIEPLPGKHVVYVSEVRGYRHEWMPEDMLAGTSNRLAWGRDHGSVASLKTLLRFRSVLLPSIYTEWRNRDSRVTAR